MLACETITESLFYTAFVLFSHPQCSSSSGELVFLGFYVQVLAKALQEGLTETALDWTNDTMTWIIRLVTALNL